MRASYFFCFFLIAIAYNEILGFPVVDKNMLQKKRNIVTFHKGERRANTPSPPKRQKQIVTTEGVNVTTTNPITETNPNTKTNPITTAKPITTTEHLAMTTPSAYVTDKFCTRFIIVKAMYPRNEGISMHAIPDRIVVQC